MSIAFQAPIFFSVQALRYYWSPAVLLLGADDVREGHLYASKAQQSFCCKRPAPYTFVMAGEEKSIRKALQR